VSGATTIEPGGAGVGAGGVALHHGTLVAGAGSAAAVASEVDVVFEAVRFYISQCGVFKPTYVKTK